MLNKPKVISESPGIYIFRRGKTPLYVGKAANLRSRLASYFTKAEGRTPKVERMLGEATRVEMIETVSEIEALIKEAELIKKYRPKYNLLMRDDKSYFYVRITREEFPKIFLTHQPKYYIRDRGYSTRGLQRPREDASEYMGPFTSGTALRAALKLLRRVFPYCTCAKPHKRPCLNSEIGRCPGHCCLLPPHEKSARPPGQIGPPKRQYLNSVRHLSVRAERNRKREYAANIRSITAVLEGRRSRLVGRLKREMRSAVKRERYEEAARLRDAIYGLEDVFAHRRVLHAPEARYPWPVVLGKLQSLLKTKREITRIEGYDISNISGTAATGSLVVFANGQPNKSQYRKFRIKTVAGISDVGMLKEVLRRRLNHPEWPYPELIVIDGGKPQLNAARSIIADGTTTPFAEYSYDRKNTRNMDKNKNTRKMVRRPMLAALAKREEILYTENGRATPLRRKDPAILHLFQRIRDESHRFARVYHHLLRKKSFAEPAHRS